MRCIVVNSVLKVLHQPVTLIRMSLSTITPPPGVRGMQVLDRDAFATEVEVPCLDIPQRLTGIPRGIVVRMLKPYLFKVRRGGRRSGSEDGVQKQILLDPMVFTDWNGLDDKEKIRLEEHGFSKDSLSVRRVQLSYESFDASHVLRAVIGDSAPNVSGFSKVGHIVHLNLRAEHDVYKRLVGEVLLDKIPFTRTVINKTANIESEYRNFTYELLAGEDDLVTTVKENGCVFHLDYGKVYWNPRLGTEHENLAKDLSPETVLYDVFAGIGPFAIPAGKRKCRVLANDLNPNSVLWMKKNIEANKVTKWVTPYNLDGREFIQTIVKEDMVARYSENAEADLRFAMNLPALAEIFLNEFCGLLNGSLSQSIAQKFRLPVVYLYCFEKEGEPLSVMERVRTYLGFPLSESSVVRTLVRQVAPKKTMIRLKFDVPRELILSERRLLAPSNDDGDKSETTMLHDPEEREVKRLRV